MRRIDAAIAFFVMLFCMARGAGAQSQAGVALAETLYQQARELMSEGRYDEACPKFEESYRLDPATGTLLNLATCHESQSKFATAWFEFQDAVTMSRRDGRPDRVSFAQGRLAELEPKLSRLTIVISAPANHPGLEIELDGARIGPAALGVPTPVDPGTHVVEARAPDRQPFREEVVIGMTAEQRTVTVPVLPESPKLAPAVPPPPRTEPPPPPPPKTEKARPIPTSAYVSGAVTAGLIVGAVVTGALYLDSQNDFERTNAKDDYDRTQTLGIVNAACWIGVATGAGLTTYFYVTRPEEPALVGAASRRAVPPGAVAHFVTHF